LLFLQEIKKMVKISVAMDKARVKRCFIGRIY
jgi:hypothetical protein